MKKLSLLIAALLVLIACSPSQKDHEQLQEHAAALEVEVKSLRSELEDVKFGAQRLLAQAKAAYETGNDAAARSFLADLLKRHPSSSESREATSLLGLIDSRIAEAERARKREAERKAEDARLAIERATANMVKNTDEIKGITWVKHRKSPILAKYVSAYFGSKDGSAENYPLRLTINYYDDNWLFVRSVTVKADDKVYELGSLNFERDHSSGSVWEWGDFPVKDHSMLQHWMSAKRVVVRFNGDKYYSDFTLPESQKQQLREVYASWQAMGGKP